jgi:hypothetical protein
MRQSYITDATLNSQLDSLRLPDVLLVGTQRSLDLAVLISAVPNDLLRAAADEVLGVQHAVDLGPDRLEELSVFDALDEVIREALLLDDIAGLVAQDADLLVRLLSADALGYEFHDDIFGRHEW